MTSSQSSEPATRLIPLSRRDEIVAAAARFFATHGYHTVGMREIAEAVGIRGASLYNHFSAKEEILFAIAEKMTRDPIENHLPILDLDGTPTTRLRALLEIHIQHLSLNRVEHLVSVREMTALTSAHRDAVLDSRRYYQRRVRDVISAGVRVGEFTTDSPRLAAIAILDMINGISWWLHDDADIPALTQAYLGFAIEGILKAPR